jgi:hypothetical protein
MGLESCNLAAINDFSTDRNSELTALGNRYNVEYVVVMAWWLAGSDA